jgi:hypothetical protein
MKLNGFMISIYYYFYDDDDDDETRRRKGRKTEKITKK